jgi:hypothetical protein
MDGEKTMIGGVLVLLKTTAGKYLLGALIVAGLVGYAAFAGYSRGVDQCEKRHKLALAESIIRAQEQAREIALQDVEVFQGGTRERERIRNVYREREVEIVKYLSDYVSCVIAPSGIRLLNDALSNAPATTPNTGGESSTLPGLTVSD